MQFTVSVLIDLYCQNHFFTFYQQKETGEITINQSGIRFSKTRTTTVRFVEMLKKSLHRCFRRIMCFSPPSWLFSNSILKLYKLRNSIIGL